MEYNTRTKHVWHFYDDSTEEQAHLGSRSFKNRKFAVEWMETQCMNSLRDAYKFTTDQVSAHLYKVEGGQWKHLESQSFHIIRAKPAHGELAPKPTE